MARIPKVLVHGIFSWGEESSIRGSCWPPPLRTELDWIFSEETGAVSSAHDRACELFYELFGGEIDYGEEHAAEFGHRRRGATLAAKWPRWSADAPVDLIGHSYGGNVCIDLALKLSSDYFGVGSDARWVRSIVTLSAPINGTTLVYLLGLSSSDHRTVRTLSAIHVAGALLATFWWLTIFFPFLRHLYDFRIRQWEGHTSLLDIWTMRHACVSSEDNAFHDLAPPRRHASNPCAADLPSTFLLSVSSQVRVRSRRFWLSPWSSRSFEVTLPWGTYNPFVLLVSLLIRLHSARLGLSAWLAAGDDMEPFEGAASGVWAHSDGIVNTCSQGAPHGRRQQQRATSGDGSGGGGGGGSASVCTEHPAVQREKHHGKGEKGGHEPLPPQPTEEHVFLTSPVEHPQRLGPGVWHRMHMGRDHLATKGLATLREIAAILDALPPRPHAQPHISADRAEHTLE
jgi:hypothetical protein